MKFVMTPLAPFASTKVRAAPDEDAWEESARLSNNGGERPLVSHEEDSFSARLRLAGLKSGILSSPRHRHSIFTFEQG
jgi:hypothetical protein